MKIFNKAVYPYIDYGIITNRGPAQDWHLPTDNTYWYVEFAKALFKLSDALPPDILSAIKNHNLYLVLCNSHEAFHEVVLEVYQHAIINLGIPEDKIILLSESADIYPEVVRVAAKYNKKEIKSVWCRVCEAGIQEAKNNMLPISGTDTLVDKPYEKKFLNFNRRWRPHRPALVALLYATGILDKGYVSLAASDWSLDWNNGYLSVISKYIDNPEIFNLLESHKEGILNLPPLYLDKTDLVTNRAELDNSTDYLYIETYFSVISETNYYDNQPGRFITEKTFKCIAQKHPFVLVTRPNSLDALRSIGYKTFSPWIDESYDLELDDNKRLLIVLKEITRLSNLSTSELTEFLNAAREICLHNYNVFINKRVFITNLN